MVKYESVRIPRSLFAGQEEMLKEITYSGAPLMRQELVVNVNRTALLGKMRENLHRHRRVHKEAVDGYRVKAENLLREALLELDRDRYAKVSVVLAFPDNHEVDYKRAIALLEAGTDEVLQMTESQYACYALDEWGWMRGFAQSARFYGSGSADLLPDME